MSCSSAALKACTVGQQGPDALQTSKPGCPAERLPFFSTGTGTVEHIVEGLPPLAQMTGGRLDVGLVRLDGLLHSCINDGLDLTDRLHVSGAHDFCSFMQSF